MKTFLTRLAGFVLLAVTLAACGGDVGDVLTAPADVGLEPPAAWDIGRTVNGPWFYATQGVQRLNGRRVPLVEGRQTVVRMWMDSGCHNYPCPEVHLPLPTVTGRILPDGTPFDMRPWDLREMYPSVWSDDTCEAAERYGISCVVRRQLPYIGQGLQEGEPGTSFNGFIEPGELRAGPLEVELRVEFADTVPWEFGRADREFKFTLQTEVVRRPETLHLVFVALHRGTAGLDASTDSVVQSVIYAGLDHPWIRTIRAVYPLGDVVVAGHDPIHAPGDKFQKLQTLERVADGDPDRYYVGVHMAGGPLGGGVARPYSNALVMSSFGAGYEYGDGDLLAHELGHNFGLAHAPHPYSRPPRGLDPDFPYQHGGIGVWGWRFEALRGYIQKWDPRVGLPGPISPALFVDNSIATSDVMGYGGGETGTWISDYHYGKVLDLLTTENASWPPPGEPIACRWPVP